jgi:hypothetical protein
MIVGSNLFVAQLILVVEYVLLQEEISALKLKFRTMNHQIEQMKEEIGSKDHLIVKEHFLHHRYVSRSTARV